MTLFVALGVFGIAATPTLIVITWREIVLWRRDRARRRASLDIGPARDRWDR